MSLCWLSLIKISKYESVYASWAVITGSVTVQKLSLVAVKDFIRKTGNNKGDDVA